MDLDDREAIEARMDTVMQLQQQLQQAMEINESYEAIIEQDQKHMLRLARAKELEKFKSDLHEALVDLLAELEIVKTKEEAASLVRQASASAEAKAAATVSTSSEQGE
jgi:hypothetical protein